MTPASDTPQPDTGKQPEWHCDHECVCSYFMMNPIFGSGVPCTRNHEGCRECNDDTRLNPIASAKVCLCGQCQIAKLSSDGEHCEEIAALIQRTLDQERLRIQNEIIRILAEHPARIVNQFFLDELRYTIRQPPSTGSTINHRITSSCRDCASISLRMNERIRS